MQKLARNAPKGASRKRITKEDIHQKAESLGIIWDYDKPGSEPFLRHSVRVTGKTHVDDMTPSEVEALYDSLEAMEKKAEITRRERRKTRRAMKRALNRFAREQGVDPKKAMLVAGGAAYLHGFRDDVNDIDFFHPDLTGFVKKQQGRFEMDGGPARDLPEEAKQWQRIGGMRVQTPEAMLAFYKRLNRPKDQEKIKSLSSRLTKTAEAGGFWRRLSQGQTGHDEAGNEIQGKTWVTKSRMRKGMKPMEHQRDFAAAAKQRLGQKGGGGIIAAHGTGTGKTFSAINTFEELKDEGKARRALVVAPAGLRVNFLQKGVQKFTGSKGVILTKPQEVKDDVEYVVVSYAAFRRDPEGWIEKVKPDTMIVDEIQRASNPNSKTHQALLWARQRVPNFMGLTASISQNDPSDIVPLLALAEKGEQQIKSKKEFKERHITKKPSKQKSIFGNTTYEKKLVRQAELNARIGAAVHYIEDLDASKKPVKDVEKVEVPMSKEQLKYYKMSMKGIDPVVLKKIREGEEVSQRQAMNIFTSLMRARQVSNSLHLASPGMSAAAAAEATPKIKKIMDDAAAHIKKTPDAQIIMYTNMVHGGVDVLTAGLKARGIPFGVFAGTGVEGITNESRQEAVDDYLAGKKKVIIITGAGAEGLSLGNTTMVQLVDGHYNPERMAQAEARGVRAGGLSHRPAEERRVRVKRYVSALPKTFWQTITFRSPDKSVGQFVYLTAERKARLNRQLRDILQQRSEHEKRKRESMMYRMFGGGP
jgi:superfamily II DNA or RNA helicase